MQRTSLYTKPCTLMNRSESTLLTLADWHQVLLGGLALADLLLARLKRLQASARPHAWIQLVDEPALLARCAELQTHAQARGLHGDALLQAFPLFGVPFAAKDNIDALGFATTAACPAWAHPAQSNATVVQKLLDAEARATRIVMQVHDELVFEVPEAELAWAREAIPRAMASVAALEVPLLAEVGVGSNWDEAH